MSDPQAHGRGMNLRLDSVTYHAAPGDLDVVRRWFEQLGMVYDGPIGDHACNLHAGDLCVDVSEKWDAAALGDPYWQVDDVNAAHAWCLRTGIEVLRPPADTGDGATVMQLGGPSGIRLYVIAYHKGVDHD